MMKEYDEDDYGPAPSSTINTQHGQQQQQQQQLYDLATAYTSTFKPDEPQQQHDIDRKLSLSQSLMENEGSTESIPHHVYAQLNKKPKEETGFSTVTQQVCHCE